MLGDSYIPWLSLFAGVVIYKIQDDGASNDNGGFINIDDFAKRIELERLSLSGIAYEKGQGREEELMEAIIHNAGVLCELGLMERKRGMVPPRLEFRVTPKGRKYDSLAHGKIGLIRCKLFFFSHCMWQRIKKYKAIITVAAFCMAVVNAVRFYNLAFTWISESTLALASIIGLFITVAWAAYASS
ncbi:MULTISPECIES: hypothetical protein [Cycloclasticus]|uniref:Uncharacterized protein n=1 Tax=Cycloclasticus pugetii TaxID=34068 RepID=A0AB33Z3P2_9GAMM|nr:MULTISPECIES: hypothetical protein [Cycloclasticus]ATI03064.1 hypothetical protein CPC19_06130 [Cycloclasticus sp. PY97N]EPD13818.1 hypothetical protein L196_04756 [Cycloclasticus pugetii]